MCYSCGISVDNKGYDWFRNIDDSGNIIHYLCYLCNKRLISPHRHKFFYLESGKQITIQKEDKIYRCRVCGIVLYDDNWPQSLKKRHQCMCNDCMRMNNRNQYRSTGRFRREEIRNQLLDILGGRNCIKCAFSDVRALQFDHIDSYGNKDRKRFKSIDSMVKYYVNNPTEARSKLQVLCANCNTIKRERNGEYY